MSLRAARDCWKLGGKVGGRKRAGRWAWRVGLVLLLYVVYTAARSWVLLANTRALLIVADRFPRDYWVGLPSGRRFTYVVMGDSTALGQGATIVQRTCAYQVAQTLAVRGFRVHVVNLAVSGSLLHEVLRDQAPRLRELHPDLVSISIGANDATHRTALEGYGRELNSLMDQVYQCKAWLILATTPDMYQTPALPWPLAWETGRRARRQNRFLSPQLSFRRVHYVDLYGHGKLIYRTDPSLYASDFFHPSDAGYAVWGGLFVNALLSRNGA